MRKLIILGLLVLVLLAGAVGADGINLVMPPDPHIKDIQPVMQIPPSGTDLVQGPEGRYFQVGPASSWSSTVVNPMELAPDMLVVGQIVEVGVVKLQRNKTWTILAFRTRERLVHIIITKAQAQWLRKLIEEATHEDHRR